VIGKVDLVMWAKDGASMLPTVLKRVEEVIPSEAVDKKIFVDDHSTDESASIAEDFGWLVFSNEKGGIGAGANLALRKVTNEHFISLEQDVVLAKDWWEKIPWYMEGKGVVVAQGWRISDHPVIGKIDEYSMERFRRSLCSIDNTIYKTEIIRGLDGFPEHLKYTGVDAHIHQRVLNAGFKWVTDSSVLSIHLRKGGLREQIRRYYLYGMDMPVLAKEELFIKAGITSRLTRSVSIALFSPFRGLEIAIKKQCPQAVYYYPVIRFSHLAGCLKRSVVIRNVA
jgi:GT2 family glycosyltransferase